MKEKVELERRKYAKFKLKSWMEWTKGDKKKSAEYVSYALNMPSLVNTSEHYRSFNEYLTTICKRWANINKTTK